LCRYVKGFGENLLQCPPANATSIPRARAHGEWDRELYRSFYSASSSALRAAHRVAAARRSVVSRERHISPPASSPLSALCNRPSRRLGAGYENIQRINPSRFAIPGNKDRVSAAMDRSDDHQIVR
jgi:hypothetical protein